MHHPEKVIGKACRESSCNQEKHNQDAGQSSHPGKWNVRPQFTNYQLVVIEHRNSISPLLLSIFITLCILNEVVFIMFSAPNLDGTCPRKSSEVFCYFVKMHSEQLRHLLRRAWSSAEYVEDGCFVICECA